jgi:hypothetical protein
MAFACGPGVAVGLAIGTGEVGALGEDGTRGALGGVTGCALTVAAMRTVGCAGAVPVTVGAAGEVAVGAATAVGTTALGRGTAVAFTATEG